MPSKVRKRGIVRYRASVTVKGQTRQKLYPDDSKRSYQDAVVWERETKKEMEKVQSQISLASLAIGSWTNEYLTEAEMRFSESTFWEKKSAFARFYRDTELSRDFPVKDLSKSICRKFLTKQFKERSGYAANKDRKNLAVAWSWGLKNFEDWPDELRNPFLSVERFSELRKPRYVPPEDEFWKVFSAAKGQDRVMLQSMFQLAARKGEIFRLKWSDIDFPNKTIRLWTKKRKDGTQEYDLLPMKSALQRTLLRWRDELSRMKGVDQEHVFLCLDEYPFCDDYYGKPFKVRQHYLKRICRKVGIEPFDFHAIRHLAASSLYREGRSLSELQAFLRHKNSNTTNRYLKSLGLEDIREALEEGLNGPTEDIQFQEMVEENQQPSES